MNFAKNTLVEPMWSLELSGKTGVYDPAELFRVVTPEGDRSGEQLPQRGVDFYVHEVVTAADASLALQAVYLDKPLTPQRIESLAADLTDDSRDSLRNRVTTWRGWLRFNGRSDEQIDSIYSEEHVRHNRAVYSAQAYVYWLGSMGILDVWDVAVYHAKTSVDAELRDRIAVLAGRRIIPHEKLWLTNLPDKMAQLSRGDLTVEYQKLQERLRGLGVGVVTETQRI